MKKRHAAASRLAAGGEKLESARKGVNFAAAALLLALLGAPGCTRPKAPLPSPLPAGRWPTYLGSQRRDAYAREAAPDTPAVAWRSDAGDGVIAPLVLDGPMLFVPSTNRLALALSAQSGKAYWTRLLAGAPTGGMVEAGGLLFMATEGGAGGTVTALPVAGGKARWSRDAPYSPHSPLLRGDTLVVATETGAVMALATADGALLWRARLPAGVAATPIGLPGGGLALAAADDSLYVLDPETHAIAARAPLGGTVSAEPTLAGDTLIVPLGTGDVAAFHVPDLAPLWSAAIGAPVLAAVQPGPDGALFALNGSAELWRIEPGTGAPRRLAALGGAARGALTLTRDGLLVGRLDGTLFLLRFDGATVWRTTLDAALVAPAAVRSGEIWVPLQSGAVVKLR